MWEAQCSHGVHAETKATVLCATFVTAADPTSKAQGARLWARDRPAPTPAGFHGGAARANRPAALQAPPRGHSCRQRPLLPSHSTRSFPPRAPEGRPFMPESWQQVTRSDPCATSPAAAPLAHALPTSGLCAPCWTLRRGFPGPGTVSRHCSRTDEFLISAGTQGHWGCSVDLVSSLFTVGPWTRLSPLQPPQTSQSASGVQRPGLLVAEAAALLFSVSYTHGHPYFSLSRLAPSPPCAALDGALGWYRRLAAGGRAAPQAHSLAAGPLCWAGPASCWSPPRNPTCRGPAR